MSFTAEVKDELSRVALGTRSENLASLAALCRLDGSLIFGGKGRIGVTLQTESAAVTRTTFKLIHELFELKTQIEYHQSKMRKTRSFSTLLPPQPGLVSALQELMIMDVDERIVYGISPSLVRDEQAGIAYLRAAFLASGFLSDPRGDFHFEINVTGASGPQLAQDIVDLLSRYGLHARINQRRFAQSIYIKRSDEILRFLALTGAHQAALALEGQRLRKSITASTNREVNSEIANSHKAIEAALAQIDDITYIKELKGLTYLPLGLRELCELRLAHPSANLRELGEYARPPLSKTAVYHRIRRIAQVAQELREAYGDLNDAR